MRYSVSCRTRRKDKTMAKRYRTPREAAAELSVSPDTILRLIGRGELPAVRISDRLYRIPVPAFERYLRGPVTRRRVVYRRVHDLPDYGEGEEIPTEGATPVGRV